MFGRGLRWLRRRPRPQLALAVLVLLVGIGYGVDALSATGNSGTPPTTAASTSASVSPAPSSSVPLSTLPSQVAQTVRLIRVGGPFPYSQDGVVFDNNEHLLPTKQHGYYHEYTVVTPGSDDRGARRIVTGQAGEFFYTSDHYESFRRVDIAR